MLATALAVAAGERDFAALAKANVFAPLGMDSTGSPAPSGVPAERFATGYRGAGGKFTEDDADVKTVGGGGIRSSISDLAKYEAALDAGSLLGAEAARMQIEPGLLDDGTQIKTGSGAAYGFGWFLSTVKGDSIAFHDGKFSGASTYWRRNLSSGLSVIVLANGRDCDTGEIARAIGDLYEGE